MRRLVMGSAVFLLLVHAIVAVGIWNATRQPPREKGRVEPLSGILTSHAEMELRAGLAALADRSREPADRFETYQTRLKTGRELLVRSLNVNPSQPDVLATLATIDYELNPGSTATRDETRRRVEAAAQLAPRVPHVQAQLGELLLRMGHTTEALEFLGRATRLDPTLSDRAVRLASTYGLEAGMIRDALPRHSAVLVALKHAFKAHDADRYLTWIEDSLEQGRVEPVEDLLWTYADTALGAGQPERLARRAEAWGPFEEPGVESARLMQMARAARTLGQPERALEWAQQGHRLAPESQRATRLLGDLARAASRPELAIDAYRHGLGLLAVRNAAPQQRAFLYRRIGEAHEDSNRTDLAYDAYMRALELDPEEPHARRRLADLSR